MKTFLTSAAAGCLTLCMGVSAQGDAFATYTPDAFATYTTLDVPGASSTRARGIDGSQVLAARLDSPNSPITHTAQHTSAIPTSTIHYFS